MPKERPEFDLARADNLNNTGEDNLFVICGEPEIGVLYAGNGWIHVKVHAVDVFELQTGEVVNDGPDGILKVY